MNILFRRIHQLEIAIFYNGLYFSLLLILVYTAYNAALFHISIKVEGIQCWFIEGAMIVAQNGDLAEHLLVSLRINENALTPPGSTLKWVPGD